MTEIVEIPLEMNVNTVAKRSRNFAYLVVDHNIHNTVYPLHLGIFLCKEKWEEAL
jgi:hypothetical protein